MAFCVDKSELTIVLCKTRFQSNMCSNSLVFYMRIRRSISYRCLLNAGWK